MGDLDTSDPSSLLPGAKRSRRFANWGLASDAESSARFVAKAHPATLAAKFFHPEFG
jgi:hypothetical protein